MEFSSRDILSRYCNDRNNSQLANDVVQAYEHEIRGVARPVANCLCPERCTSEDFFRATLNRARFKFIRGVCSYKGDTPRSWKAWLGEVARTAALDELDFLIHRRWNTPIFELGPEQVFAEDISEGSEDGEGSWDRAFCSAHHRGVMAELLPQPDAAIKAEERKSVTLRLLVLHAQKSQEDADSANAIRLRYWDDWSVVKIAEYRFGEPMTAGKEQAIRRELCDDYD